MSIKVSSERMGQIERIEYGLNGDIGGLPKTTYYTPDGRVIRAISSIREYVIRDKDGKVTGSGTRDANLDRGWLLSPPTVLKRFCKGCDKWHDTQGEVNACITQQNKFVNAMGRRAKKEEADKTSALEKQIAELTALVNKLTEVQNRQILQREGNESTQIPAELGK